MRKTGFLVFMILVIMLSVTAVLMAEAGVDPEEYCLVAAPPQFYNACVVCAAHGSLGPYGDGRICICKTIMSGFGGPPIYNSFGECMKDVGK